MPKGLARATVVPYGDTFVVVGGYTDNAFTVNKDIMIFGHNGWTLIPVADMEIRSLAFLVADDFASCT